MFLVCEMQNLGVSVRAVDGAVKDLLEFRCFNLDSSQGEPESLQERRERDSG